MLSSRLSRHFPPILVGIVVFTASTAGTSSDASAQRLFQRLRARIQANRAPAPTPPQANRPQTASPYGVQPKATTQAQPRVLARPQQKDQPDTQQPNNANSARTDGGSGNPPGGKPTFGIEVSPVRVGQYAGLQITGFTAESKADDAGLRRGDVIISIDGIRTSSLAQVAELQQRQSPNQPARVQMIRDGRMYQANVPVIQIPEVKDSSSIAKTKEATKRRVAKPPISASPGEPTLAKPRSSLGIQVREASPKRGIEVVNVTENNAGAIAGLQPEDRIVSVDGRLVRNIDALIREMSLGQPGQTVVFGIVREDKMLELETELGGPGGKPIQSASKPKTEVPAEKSTNDSGSSILGGVGSALGGLFGGKSKSDSQGKSDSTLPMPQSTDLPSPTPSSKESLLPSPVVESIPSLDGDPLALPAE